MSELVRALAPFEAVVWRLPAVVAGAPRLTDDAALILAGPGEDEKCVTAGDLRRLVAAGKEAVAQLAAAHRAIEALAARYQGLRRCPDCEAELAEGAAHAATCPVGVAEAVLRAPETAAYARWVRGLELVAVDAAVLLGGSFAPVGPTLARCVECGRVSADGRHKDDCRLRSLHEAVQRYLELEAG